MFLMHLSFVVWQSYFNPLAVQNIKHEFFVIDAEFEKNERTEQIVCSLKKGQKKNLKRNRKNSRYLIHRFYYLVIISPTDRDLIVEGSETRRKFMDSVISQLDAHYLQINVL
jgi:DNA replication and repair protein RecF